MNSDDFRYPIIPPDPTLQEHMDRLKATVQRIVREAKQPLIDEINRLQEENESLRHRLHLYMVPETVWSESSSPLVSPPRPRPETRCHNEQNEPGTSA